MEQEAAYIPHPYICYRTVRHEKHYQEYNSYASLLMPHCPVTVVYTNCVNVSKSYYDYMYHRVPRDLVGGDDNNSVCGYLHRKGTLCGQCMHNYYRAAYSYTFHCIYCEESQWLLYIVVAYVPLTFFIIFILVFRVSVVSPKLYGTISMLQTLASP